MGRASTTTGRDRSSKRRVSLAVWMHADGTITDANDAFVSLTGYSRSELRGTPFSTLVEDDLPSLESLVADDATSPVSTTLPIRTSAETRRSIEIHLERVATDGDESRVVGLVNRRATSTKSVSSSEFTYGRTFQALADALPTGSSFSIRTATSSTPIPPSNASSAIRPANWSAPAKSRSSHPPSTGPPRRVATVSRDRGTKNKLVVLQSGLRLCRWYSQLRGHS